MSLNFEEIDFRSTPIGDLILRRRRMPQFGDTDIFEVKLGEDFLMTSLFHESEDQLAILGLKAIDRPNLDVVVGGLGLGYTAVAALKDQRVSSLTVVEYLEGVIDWHNKGLVPTGSILTSDDRCQFVHADFFSLAKDTNKSFDPKDPQRKHDVILLDIDHTPTNVLNPTNTYIYTEAGLTELASHLKPGGVFALWADGIADNDFTEHLKKMFVTAEAHTITFDNPVNGSVSKGAVYVAQTHPLG